MGVKKLTPAAPAAALSAASRTKGLPTRDKVFSSRAKSSSCHPTSTLTTTLAEASQADNDSSDEETHEPQTHGKMKDKPHQNKKKHSFQPPGRSSVEETKQRATANKEGIPSKEKEKDAAEKTDRVPEKME